MKEKKQSWQVVRKAMLVDFLGEVKTDVSRKDLKNYIKYEMVTVNGKTVTRATQEVTAGDEVSLFYQKVVMPEFNLRILYEDKDLIVIDKPGGLLSISNDKEKEITAFKMVRSYVRKKDPKCFLFDIHRLDQETSGVLMFGKNPAIKEKLQENWNEIVKKRGYWAIVPGTLQKKKGRFASYLKEDRTGRVYSARDKHGKYAITNYEVLRSNGKYSLLDVNIETGRRNQIRVHLSEAGFPIVGDKKYGSKDNGMGRLALHAYELDLIDPRNGELMKFRSERPQEFDEFVR